MAKKKKTKRWLLVLLALAPVAITLAVYFRALKGGFVFDDSMFLGHWCWQIEDFRELFQVTQRPVCGYRPVRFFSMALDHAIWGKNPFGYHLTNYILHGISVLLVFGLLKKLVRNPFAAAAGALLWGIHPINTDVVSYISGRRDVLFSVFYLAGFLLWPFKGGSLKTIIPRVFLVALCYVLAFQSKEMAITLPLVIVLYIVFRPSLEAAANGEAVESPFRRAWTLLKRHIWALIPIFVLAAIAFADRAILHPATRSTSRWWGGDPLTHIGSVFAAYSKYLEWLVFPTRLYGDYSDFPVASGLADPRVWLGGFFLFSLWGLGFALARRCPYLSFGLLWFGVALLPVSQIIYHHELLAEHYLYLPLVGFAVVAARVIAVSFTWSKKRYLLHGALVVILVLYAFRVDSRNRDFTNEETFGQAILRYVPDSIRGRLILAHYYQKNDRLDEAGELFRWILAREGIQPRFRASALENLIKVYATQGDLERAEALINRALSRNPNYALGLRILGTIFARRGQLEPALEHLQRALEIKPEDIEGHLHYGMTLMLADRFEDALPHIQYAAERWRTNPYAQLQWALLQFARNNTEEARLGFERVLELDPQNLGALEHLFLMARRVHDDEWACDVFERLQPLRPDLADVTTPCDRVQGSQPQ